MNGEVVKTFGEPGSANGDSFTYGFRVGKATDRLAFTFDKKNQVAQVALSVWSSKPTMAEVSRWLGAKPVWVLVRSSEATEYSMRIDAKGDLLPNRTSFWIHGLLKDGKRVEYGPFYSPVTPIRGDKQLNLQTNRYEVVNFRFNNKAPIYKSRPEWVQLHIAGPFEGEPAVPHYRIVKIE